MIVKINKIKNLGLVFADFTWKASAPSFKRFNLFYGWNGCGKTTFTRLFDVLEGAPIGKLEYELEIDDGTKYKEGEAFPKEIRVFNQDYIQKNVEIIKSHANSISILLGEENKDLIEQIEKDEVNLNGDPKDPADIGKIAHFNGYTQKQARKEKEKEAKFSEIAKVIGAATVGSGTATRVYRNPDAKKDFESLSEKTALDDKDLETCADTVRQELLPQEKTVQLTKLSDLNGLMIDSLGALETALLDGRALLGRTVESEMLIRLVENPDISEWIERGIHVHKNHASENCEYCGNQISVGRLKQLAGHFNEEDRKLKESIDGLIDRLRKIYSNVDSIQIPDTARLYKELKPPYDLAREELSSSKKELLNQITAFAEEIKGKKNNTNKALASVSEVNSDSFVFKLKSLNEIIDSHNTKTTDFQKLKETAIVKLRNHYLSTIFDEVKSLNKEISDLGIDLKAREAEIKGIKDRIAKNRSQISSTHKACENINKGLQTFLGRNEIQFMPDTKNSIDHDGDKKEVVIGYHIMRGDQPAIYLSEGEKTAIAFVYFVVHLQDGQFSPADGIVVIDDPISSLDSNSLYQAFSFLKNAVIDCGQVFILTHSFDFLKLLLNWRKHADGNNAFYMIKNTFPDDKRVASIEEMDKELSTYESEYHYLFKLLKLMRDTQDGTIEKAYPVPNIARKVWETFLMFRVPNGENPYKKMELLKKDSYDAQKLDAIYKFINDQSHMTGSGFDPALVPETKKVVAEILEMMAIIAPEHFGIIDHATN